MNYTSIEQSKKLLELGLRLESADMYYKESITTGEFYPLVFQEYYTDELKLEKLALKQYSPCWSAGQLISIMPKNRCKTTSHETCYTCSYSDVLLQVYNYFHEDTLIDACYKMVVWLLENNFIKKGE